MKIGILTHHYVKNFGATLQAMALSETLKQLTLSSQIEFIDLKIEKHWFKNTVRFFVYRNNRDSILSFIEKLKLLKTHSLAESNLPMSKRMSNADNINNNGYDLIIVGSDEVWNYKDISYSPIKFGYGLTGSKLVTYAPSVGSSKINNEMPEVIKIGINSFDKISVRDSNSGEFVEELTKLKPELVLDPVFLYDFPKVTLNKKLSQSIKDPYILIYDCRLEEKQKIELLKYAKLNKLKIIGAGEYRDWYDELTTNITPLEWVTLFKRAALIITGTFHGVSFSVKYNKKFVAYVVEDNRIEKISSLLKDLSLKRQIITKNSETDFINLLDSDIDYDVANKKVKIRYNNSIEYLKNCIKLVEEV